MKSDTILRGARILIAILTTCFTTPLLAQGTNLVYINGINTTRAKALIHMFEIQSSIVNQAVPAGRKFSFDFVHNPIGFYNVKDNTEDHYELFLLKTAEECFRADYLQILSPHNQSRAIDRNAASKVNAFLDRMLPGPTGGHSCGENYLTYYKKVTDADMAGTQKAAIALADQVKKLGSAIVVAHSQGNLLAHLAYARIASSEGSDTNRMMRVVNVANTSSISVNGLDLTHEKDLALLGLKVYGINFSRSTPDCNSSLCRFTNAPATIQGVITGLADKDNHDLITTYLSAQTANLLDSQGVNLTAGQITFAGRFKDFVNAAATSLELAQTLPPSPVVSLLSDSFDGPTIDSTKWNSTGQSTISAGLTCPHSPYQ